MALSNEVLEKVYIDYRFLRTRIRVHLKTIVLVLSRFYDQERNLTFVKTDF